MELLSKAKKINMSNYLFYIAFFIELLLMIIEKSELPFSYESYVFRITFLLTMGAVLLMPHNKKEWLVIAIIWGLSIISYKSSGKNDLLRFTTFIMAARDIDIKKTIKYAFFTCLTGFGAIALLAILRLYGDISLYTDFGRSVGNETRYVFGFGHPNTLFSSAYMLLIMWLWLYGESSKIYQLIITFLLMGIISVITVSRTGMLIISVTFIAAFIIKLFPDIKSYKAPYIITTVISPIICVIASILAAITSEMAYLETLPGVSSWYFFMLDEKLNYRISALYFAPNHDGVLSHWKLFAAHDTDAYFDMGWVRIFYWYGIIPGTIITLLIIVFLWCCWRQKDLWTVLLILSLGVYTIIEATFVSRYIGRNILLPVFGVYIGKLLTSSPIVPIEHQKDYQRCT